MSNEQKDELAKTELVIHNGEILNPIPGVKTEQAQTPANLTSVQDIEPELLSSLMVGVISASREESPEPTAVEVVNRLLTLKTSHGHKVVWTRFDINQLFAIYSNKLDRTRNGRNG